MVRRGFGLYPVGIRSVEYTVYAVLRYEFVDAKSQIAADAFVAALAPPLEQAEKVADQLTMRFDSAMICLRRFQSSRLCSRGIQSFMVSLDLGSAALVPNRKRTIVSLFPKEMQLEVTQR